MTYDDAQSKPPTLRDLPPFIYETIAVLAVWLVLSAWIFGLQGGYVDLSLVIVTLFFVIAVGIPFLLWRIARNEQILHADEEDKKPFRDWISSDFEIWQGRLNGREAAMQILLPIAAVSFGMTAFALAFYFVTRSIA